MDLYTQFDGEEINGVRYKLGDAIERDVDAGTVRYLLQTGRLSDTPPNTDGVLLPPMRETPLLEMSRAELETTARNSIDLSELSDEELIKGIERHRNAARGEAIETGDAMEGAETGTPTPSPTPTPAPAPSEPPANDPVSPKTDEQLAEVLAVPVPSVAIRVGEMGDLSEVERLRELEVKGENRTTALAAIDARIAALKSTD